MYSTKGRQPEPVQAPSEQTAIILLPRRHRHKRRETVNTTRHCLAWFVILATRHIVSRSGRAFRLALSCSLDTSFASFVDLRQRRQRNILRTRNVPVYPVTNSGLNFESIAYREIFSCFFIRSSQKFVPFPDTRILFALALLIITKQRGVLSSVRRSRGIFFLFFQRVLRCVRRQ